jgi:rhamnulokinase
MPKCYLACDLGADSGRLMLGTLEQGRLTIEEIHRFANVPLRTGESLRWDIARLLGEVKEGLRKAAARQLPIASISTDSWGVDYLLYDAAGAVIPPAFHYRDPRCADGVQQAQAKISWPEIFAETGLQFLPFNTIFQLAAETPARLAAARLILGIGDAFNHWLSGVARAEESLASTSQLYDPRQRAWSSRLLAALNLPTAMFPPIVKSGTHLGPLRADLAAETGLRGVEVIASCSHDTGAAVAAVPGAGDDWAYLSSGTWSLMGVELPQPIITDACRDLNFTNEIGFGHSVRLLKNIVGLWLIQESRREWSRAGEQYSYAELEKLAAAAPPFVSLINPADPRFLSPGEMPAKIAACCRETGQPVPTTAGATIRCVYESVALLYRRTLRQIEQLTDRRIQRLHIVGGGSKDAVLSQFAANAVQLPVHTGPVEGTAIGNILVQAIARGDLPSLAAARDVVRASFETKTYQPQDADAWAAAVPRFDQLLAATTPAAGK